MQVNYSLVATVLGWIAVAEVDNGLRRVELRAGTASDAEARILRACPGATRVETPAGDLGERLRRYALGEAVEFPDPIDVSGAGPFFQRVWSATRSIPRGETRSYQWLAEQVGSPRAARAVGQAMARNPVPIILPCHRVVGSNGGLCGFGGGLDLKERMLRLEQRKPAAAQLAFAVH